MAYAPASGRASTAARTSRSSSIDVCRSAACSSTASATARSTRASAHRATAALVVARPYLELRLHRRRQRLVDDDARPVVRVGPVPRVQFRACLLRQTCGSRRAEPAVERLDDGDRALLGQRELRPDDEGNPGLVQRVGEARARAGSTTLATSPLSQLASVTTKGWCTWSGSTQRQCAREPFARHDVHTVVPSAQPDPERPPRAREVHGAVRQDVDVRVVRAPTRGHDVLERCALDDGERVPRSPSGAASRPSPESSRPGYQNGAIASSSARRWASNGMSPVGPATKRMRARVGHVTPSHETVRTWRVMHTGGFVLSASQASDSASRASAPSTARTGAARAPRPTA